MPPRAKKKAKLVTEIPPSEKNDDDTEAKALSGAAAFSVTVLENLVCPITHQLFVDPYIAEDGRLYEKAAISKWLNSEKRSPVTNEPMRASSATSKRGTCARPSFEVAPRAQGNAPREVADGARAHRVCN